MADMLPLVSLTRDSLQSATYDARVRLKIIQVLLGHFERITDGYASYDATILHILGKKCGATGTPGGCPEDCIPEGKFVLRVNQQCIREVVKFHGDEFKQCGCDLEKAFSLWQQSGVTFCNYIRQFAKSLQQYWDA
jgi:hypothetical protein